LKTITVKKKSSGKEILINEEDFNPELFDHVRVKLDPKPAKTEGRSGPATVSTHTRDDLAKMSSSAIKALPEWSRVPDPDKHMTKEALVDAIIAARG